MTDKVQKIREGVEKLKSQLIRGSCSSQIAMETRCKEEAYNEVISLLDSLQEEPVSEQNLSTVERIGKDWKDAQGDDLPEIDREVVALLDNGKVVFAHRPPEYWDGKDIVTGKVTRNYPKTYDKGGWNIPNVKWWLDCSMPKEIEP
jgi:hypothetical protein